MRRRRVPRQALVPAEAGNRRCDDTRQQSLTANATATGDGTPAQTTLDRITGRLHLDTTGAVPTTGAIKVSYEWNDKRVFRDDGHGQIVGEDGAAGVLGTVVYDTDALSVTFTAAPPNGQVWTVAC